VTPLIAARGLDAGYGKRLKIVVGLDLEVHPGEVVALLGANGAGKTTTLLTLAGELPALGGEIRWQGRPTTSPLHWRARRGLALVTEQRAVLTTMTVAENLRLTRCDGDRALELFPELRDVLGCKVGLLSGGQQQMLALAWAMARPTNLLLADELSLGLAPLVVGRLLRAVRDAADAGLGVLLVEQHIHKALEVADRVYVMQRGRVQVEGRASEMRSRVEEIQASYLSLGEDARSSTA
jgi:ABC-type branched-subunit amino acid transport system ATPase component